MDQNPDLAQVSLGLVINVPLAYFRESNASIEMDGEEYTLERFRATVYAEADRIFKPESAEFQKRTFDGYLEQIAKAVREGGENAANAEEANDDKEGQASREEVT